MEEDMGPLVGGKNKILSYAYEKKTWKNAP